jgi:hypothetical protein
MFRGMVGMQATGEPSTLTGAEPQWTPMDADQRERRSWRTPMDPGTPV